MNLSEHIKLEFPNKKVVILGDMVADQFLNGTISRVSREAPVFILRHDMTETAAGGAANAAVNVASLGGTAEIIGLAGKDQNGELLLAALKNAGVNCAGVVTSDRFQTTTKVRVLAGQQYARRQQVIRIDYENRAEIDAAVMEELRENMAKAVVDADAIIVSDYNYGAASPELAAAARKIADEQGIPILLDSRFRLTEFPGANAATPNEEEVERLLGKQIDDIEDLEAELDELLARLNYKSLLITRGNKGMILAEKGKPLLTIEAVGPKEPVDVTGAGDTVIAAFALSLASGLGFADAARIANHAGGIVVMKKGTSSIGIDELLASIESGEGFRERAQTR